MLQLNSSTKIFVHLKPVDFRKGMDGLAAICRNEMKINPYSGAIFVFRNRKQTALKLLVYDGQGFWAWASGVPLFRGTPNFTHQWRSQIESILPGV